jgi:hypothetical protein
MEEKKVCVNFNKFYKYLHFDIIRKLRYNNLPPNEYFSIKTQFKDSMKRLKQSLQNINDKITRKKVWQKVPNKNINDVMYMNNQITTIQTNCINKVKRERPHLLNILSNLFDTYKPNLTLTLYDLIDVSNNKIRLNHYNESFDKLMIIGNVDLVKYKNIFIQINKYFDINLPNNSYLISHDNRYKELNKLLNNIKISCFEFIIGRTDKTRKVLIVDSKYYFKEINKHLDKKFIYIGNIDEGEMINIVDVFIDNNKIKLPNCCLLFKDHKSCVITLKEDLWFKYIDNIPSRLIITYPHYMYSKWSEILHEISIKMFRGFKEILLTKYSCLKLFMLKDSFELYDYINYFVNIYNNDSLTNEIILDSFKYTYDVVEMYDNLLHNNVKDIIYKIHDIYKIINYNEMLILQNHIDKLYVRVGDNILRQTKGLPMGSSVSPILAMIVILDICINHNIENILLYIDDFKLLSNDRNEIERFKYLLKKELDLDIVINKEDGSMLELVKDDWDIFYYDLDKQRRHINNNKLSIPHYSNTFDNVGDNVYINVIKGYQKKIRTMSYLPKYFINNNINLMYRCFNSGQLMNYVLSRNNRLIKTRKHRYQLTYRDIGQMNKEINKKVQLEEDKCSNDVLKTLMTRLSKVLLRLCD